MSYHVGEHLSEINLPKIQLNESHNERTSLSTYDLFKTMLQGFGEVVVRGSSYRPITTEQLQDKKLLIIGGPEKGMGLWSKC